MNLVKYVEAQKKWSQQTFGDGKRVQGLIKHIFDELIEIIQNPNDIYEWIDVVILALDGAWRQGYTPKEIAAALEKKQQINFQRKWQEADDNSPSYHKKEETDGTVSKI